MSATNANVAELSHNNDDDDDTEMQSIQSETTLKRSNVVRFGRSSASKGKPTMSRIPQEKVEEMVQGYLSDIRLHLLEDGFANDENLESIVAVLEQDLRKHVEPIAENRIKTPVPVRVQPPVIQPVPQQPLERQEMGIPPNQEHYGAVCSDASGVGSSQSGRRAPTPDSLAVVVGDSSLVSSLSDRSVAPPRRVRSAPGLLQCTQTTE